MSEEAAATVEKHGFGAEVGRLLDLVVHSLYSEREIFLRELVANAADATDRRRFESLTDQTLALPENARIRLVPDKASRTLLLSDDGVGMTREELIDNLGTIARSGTAAAARALATASADERPSLIGQFGVGFYSAFMVADRVEVTSRKAGTEQAYTWASEGAGEFTIAPGVRDKPGTDIVLHMKPDAEEYLEPIRLQTIVRKWADHITLPITIADGGEEKPANEGTALWRKSKSEVAPEAVTDFYRHIGNIFDTPWATLHWKAEGTIEYFAMLFIPGMKPFDAVEGDRESHVRLHVKRMFITDRAGLLPPWLRFVQGVVDTEDLPLNVSREMLQTTPVLARIRRAVTNRVITELKTRSKKAVAPPAEDAETVEEDASYDRLWENFGAVMKEGVWDDAEHRDDITPLLRFRSSTQEGWTSFEAYVERMQPEQEKIYYLVGENEAALRSSPQIEGFRARGIEVLLLSDPIDAFWPERLDGFAGKKLANVTQSGADLTSDGDMADVTALCVALKASLGEAVHEVRASHRLVDSAVLLAAGAGPDLQMQRLLRRAGRSGYQPAPDLEINPKHPLIAELAQMQANTGESERNIDNIAGVLLDLARVQEGEAPRDPGEFARRITDLLTGIAKSPQTA
jgi:molecular chaperone HtpG